MSSPEQEFESELWGGCLIRRRTLITSTECYGSVSEILKSSRWRRSRIGNDLPALTPTNGSTSIFAALMFQQQMISVASESMSLLVAKSMRKAFVHFGTRSLPTSNCLKKPTYMPYLPRQRSRMSNNCSYSCVDCMKHCGNSFSTGENQFLGQHDILYRR